MIRRMENRTSIGAKRDRSSGAIPPEQMTRLQQLGSCDDAMAVPEVAGEVPLYRIIRRRYGGHEQGEQPGDADQRREAEAFPLA
jgi:hypothetical protein